MKKAFLAITSLWLLLACSDELVQETENTLPTTYTEDPGIPYKSPFTNGICCSLVYYHFINESDLDLSFVPYIGIARFDDNNDYAHFGTVLAPATHPNVLFNGMEYLNLIECLPIFTGAYSSYFSVHTGQLPTIPTPYTPPTPAIFEIMNKPPSTYSVEDGFLYEHGKFYAFEATVTDPVTGNPVINEHLKFPFLPQGVTDPYTLSGEWLPLPPAGPETEDLWYHHETLEICIGNDYINHPGGGVGWNDKPSIVEFSYNGTEYRLEAYTTLTDFVIQLQVR